MYPSKSFVAFDLTFWSMMHFKLIFYMKNSGTIYWKDYYFPFGFTCQRCWNRLTMNVRVYRRRQWYPTPVLLPGKSHGWRSLVACSPWGHEESDMTERLHFHFHFYALEKEMATHSNVLAWRIPGMGSQSGHDWSDLAVAAVAVRVYY